MKAIERLLALREIEDLITRYCHAFDDQDWDALAALWTEDATFVAAGVAFEGRTNLLEFLTSCLPVGFGGRHFCARSLIELEPDETRAHAQTDVIWIPENFEITILARYRDTIVQRDGRWLFLVRDELPVEFKPGPVPMSETATSVSSSSMRS